MAIDFNEYNEAVKSWGSKGLGLIKSSGRSLNIQHRSNSPSSSDSLNKIKDRYGNDSSGVINRVSFTQINRSLIYTIVGAGKGLGGRKGSRWIDRHGNNKRTASASLGKLGSGSRQPKPFIDAVLDGQQGVEELGDIVANYQADAIIQSVILK